MQWNVPLVAWLAADSARLSSRYMTNAKSRHSLPTRGWGWHRCLNNIGVTSTFTPCSIWLFREVCRLESWLFTAQLLMESSSSRQALSPNRFIPCKAFAPAPIFIQHFRSYQQHVPYFVVYWCIVHICNTYLFLKCIDYIYIKNVSGALFNIFTAQNGGGSFQT